MRRVWLLTLVFMLLLAACAHPRPAGEGRGDGGSASLPAATPLPPTATRPPTPTPTPTPTPGPEALTGEIYPYLNHYLGRPEATFVSDKTLWGTSRLSPPDNHLFAAYGIVQDGASKYVLVSNGLNADLVPADQVPQDVLSSLQTLDLTTDEARTKIDRSRAWMYYMENFRLGKFTLHLRNADGSKHEDFEVDMKRFIEDRKYGLEVLRYIYENYDVVNPDTVGVPLGRNPNRYERQHIEDLYDGMRMIYYHTEFSPDRIWLGRKHLTVSEALSSLRYLSSSGIGHLGLDDFDFAMPYMEYDKNKGRLTFAHTNIDILVGNRDKYAVYNPFTPDVKPRAVRVNFWQGTDRSTLYGALLVRVTDPDTGKSLYFEFEHLTAAHRENGSWAPENELWGEALKHNNWGWANNLNIPLEEGQLLGYVSDPKTDIYSNAYHVQFGQIISPKAWVLNVKQSAVLNPYTAALQVYFMTHQADRYMGMWEEKPSGSGFWMGGRQAGS